MNEVIFQDLGLMDYKQAWDYQEKLFQEVITQKLSLNQTDNRLPADLSTEDLSQVEASAKAGQPATDNYLLFCEHPPVITLGKSGKDRNLLMSESWLKQNGIDYYHINRGGDITFHGPGQIVGYPIINLDMFFTDIHKYLRLLEEMIIKTLDEFGIKGERIPHATGVWIDSHNPSLARKICAMGIRSSRWVTMHGFALNVNTDLSFFNCIVPCGINDKQVTSLEKELGTKVDMEVVKQKLMRHFEQLFGVQLTTKSREAALK